MYVVGINEKDEEAETRYLYSKARSPSYPVCGKHYCKEPWNVHGGIGLSDSPPHHLDSHRGTLRSSDSTESIVLSVREVQEGLWISAQNKWILGICPTNEAWPGLATYLADLRIEER